MEKCLVTYFSATDTTGRVARELAQAIGADIFEIAPETPYTSADLNWTNRKSRSSVEMNDESCRPALAGSVPDLSAYDVVFVGFPVWWYVEPRIIDTFLETGDFAGKTIVPFATSGGSGLGEAPARMQTFAPNAKVLSGKLLNGKQTAKTLSSWVEGLEL